MELEIVSKVYGKHIVYFDKDDFEEISKYRWHLRKGKRTFYAAAFNKGNHKVIRSIKMHQLLTGKKGIDHIDGNGLNNKRNNLREATQTQNSRNMRMKINSTTGFKGVTFRKRKGLYKARIRVDGVLIQGVGSTNIYRAALNYNEMALKYFGEFARINILTSKQIELSKVDIPLKRYKSNITGFRGVSLGKHKKYIATIFVDGKNIGLGSNFCDAKSAAIAYNEAVIKYNKPESYLNKI